MTVARAGGCPLCRAERITAWHHEDDVCWVADCELCRVPMVVWKQHGIDPDPEARYHMLAVLDRVGRARFGEGGFHVDGVMRNIPDHFHAHARDPEWWVRRFGRAATP